MKLSVALSVVKLIMKATLIKETIVIYDWTKSIVIEIISKNIFPKT